jgi:uncharacterized protein (DUF39 family)
MSPEWLVGVSFRGYGSSLAVGLGIPIPILDENMAIYTAVKDEDIYTQIIDYSSSYPNLEPGSLGKINYKQMKSGSIEIQGKKVPTSSLSSYPGAKKIANTLKEWIQNGKFLLSEPVQPLPSADSGLTFKGLKERPI